jgi:CelD/BcsL family acetyltransferase involved in cellulose biosynthesis
VSDSAPGLLVTRELGSWASQWDGLAESSSLPSPFLRSWWLAGTAEVGSRFLLVVRDGLLLGGLAMQQERVLGLPCVRMLGSGALCPDHLDLLAGAGHELAVISAVAGWLKRPGPRLVDLSGVRADSLVIRALPGRVRQEELPAAPWAPLGMTAEQYLADRPPTLRKTLRRALSRLSDEGVSHHVHRGSSAVTALAVLRHMHHAQWGKRSRFLPGFDRFAAACARGAQADEVAVHDLSAAGTTIAIMVTFEMAGRVSLYQSARLTDFRWRDASSVLLAEIIADASRRGFSEVDFLRGDEAYKGNFASVRRPLLRLQAASGGVGALGLATATAARRARRLMAAAARRS